MDYTVPAWVLWIVAGLVFYFDWWWLPDPPPDGKPQPDPWRPVSLPELGLSVVGGVAGGAAVFNVWATPGRQNILEMVGTVVGSYLGSRLLVGVYRLATGRRAPARAR